HVFDDARDGLVLVHHAIDPERPHCGAPQRRQQQAPQRIAQRVAVAPLQRLEPELGGIRVVLALGHLDQMRPDQPRQIKSRNHLEKSSTINCYCAASGMATRVGRSVILPSTLSVSTWIHETGCPRQNCSSATFTCTSSRLASATRTSSPRRTR